MNLSKFWYTIDHAFNPWGKKKKERIIRSHTKGRRNYNRRDKMRHSRQFLHHLMAWCKLKQRLFGEAAEHSAQELAPRKTTLLQLQAFFSVLAEDVLWRPSLAVLQLVRRQRVPEPVVHLRSRQGQLVKTLKTRSFGQAQTMPIFRVSPHLVPWIRRPCRAPAGISLRLALPGSGSASQLPRGSTKRVSASQ